MTTQNDERLKTAIRNLLIHVCFTNHEQAAIVFAVRETMEHSSVLKEHMKSALEKLNDHDVTIADYQRAFEYITDNSPAFLLEAMG